MRKPKTAAIALAGALALPGLASVSTTEAAVGNGTYGALAYSPSDHLTAAFGYGSTEALAEQTAEAACSKHAGDCLPIATFTHAYAAYATGRTVFTWGSAPTQADANSTAIYWCHYYGGGSACAVRLTAETSAPSSAGRGVNLTARMCMINAPSGVTGKLPGGLEVVGHVGWAFLLNKNTGMWEFGANEGPANGKPAEEWHQEGTWPTVESVFTHKLTVGKTVYHPADFYETYRCGSEPAGYTSDAQAKVASEQGSIYYLPFVPGHPQNDCLSNAVDILSADGVPLPSDVEPITNALPNNYYDNLLPSVFSSVADL